MSNLTLTYQLNSLQLMILTHAILGSNSVFLQVFSDSVCSREEWFSCTNKASAVCKRDSECENWHLM